MKSLKNLGKTLSKNEQQNIKGGQLPDLECHFICHLLLGCRRCNSL